MPAGMPETVVFGTDSVLATHRGSKRMRVGSFDRTVYRDDMDRQVVAALKEAGHTNAASELRRFQKNREDASGGYYFVPRPSTAQLAHQPQAPVTIEPPPTTGRISRSQPSNAIANEPATNTTPIAM